MCAGDWDEAPCRAVSISEWTGRSTPPPPQKHNLIQEVNSPLPQPLLLLFYIHRPKHEGGYSSFIIKMEEKVGEILKEEEWDEALQQQVEESVHSKICLVVVSILVMQIVLISRGSPAVLHMNIGLLIMGNTPHLVKQLYTDASVSLSDLIKQTGHRL